MDAKISPMEEGEPRRPLGRSASEKAVRQSSLKYRRPSVPTLQELRRASSRAMSGVQSSAVRASHIITGEKVEEAVKELKGFKDRRAVCGAVAVMLAYFVLGILCYAPEFSRIQKESENDNYSGNPAVNAVYFTIVTFTTIGYGDLYPQTDELKLFTCFFSFLGVGFIGTALGVIGGYILDKEDLSEESGGTEEKEKSSAWKCSMRPDVRRIFITGIGVVTALVGGTTFFVYQEDMRWVDALYMCSVTVTTVGYGDFSPKTETGRLFSIFYIIVSVILVTKFLGDLAKIPLKRRRRNLERKVLGQFGKQLTAADLTEITQNTRNPGTCTKAEFVVEMLKKLNKVKPRDMREIEFFFNQLDADGSGELDADDIKRGTSGVNPFLALRVMRIQKFVKRSKSERLSSSSLRDSFSSENEVSPEVSPAGDMA